MEIYRGEEIDNFLEETESVLRGEGYNWDDVASIEVGKQKISVEHFKKLVMQHLDELEEKENAEKNAVKKAIIEAESLQKSGYPVGTIREWKGKKYIKVAPNKWRPKYDDNSRGAKLAIAALKRKADKCQYLHHKRRN